MGYFLIIFLIVVFIIMICVIANNVETNKINEELFDEFDEKIKKYGYSLAIDSTKVKIYINQKTKKWVLACEDKHYNFKDVLSCEIIENNHSIMNTVSKKHVSVGKALVGDALFGPVGAIIGGTSGKITSNSKQEEVCNNLKIKITLKNFEEPCKFIELINSNTAINSGIYKEKFELAQKILSLFQVIINDNNSVK